jgi:sulfate adenylyltransferase
MARTIEMIVNQDAWLETQNIGSGVFFPLKGFMDSADYKSVVENMCLDNGEPWTIPVTLAVPDDKVACVIKANKIVLKSIFNKAIAELSIEDVYRVDFNNDIKKIFSTEDKKHPGVAKELARSSYRVGGEIKVLCQEDDFFSAYSLSPAKTKQMFRAKGWNTIVGFQTRNPIHRAHEYLQRVGMEVADGIFIQPLIGWKKNDDFSPEAVIKSYEKMLDVFYPKNKVMLGVLKTPMRYAGPREAIFHAIIRRNYGCTHFIIGRDHAGVGNFYGKYDAHRLCDKFDNLGIDILKLCGPYYCGKCDGIVTEKTCPHGERYAISISGTEVRSLFSHGKYPPETYMRKEISDILIKLNKKNKLFCGVKTKNSPAKYGVA